MKKLYIAISIVTLLLIAVLFPFKSRDLSESELEIAQAIFGESIEYSRVRIEEGGILTWIYPGVTLGNTIAFPKGAYDELNLKDQALLLHELTHVWQYQNSGLGYIPRALYEEIFTDAYVVHYDEAKSFADYDIEEQGEIVAEYHLTGEPLFSVYIEELQLL
jgi:hypothetical protein